MQSNIRILMLMALTACGAAHAQSSTFKFGVVRYDAHSKTNGVTGIGIPPGADATVGDATTVVFTYEYEVKPNVGIELVLGVPPKITAKGSGTVAFLGEVLTARNVAPTVFLTYHFGQDGDKLRPYGGIGLNYTKFTGASTPYGWNVKLSDSVGLAAHAGLNYALDKQWGLFGSVARIDVKTNLVATGAVVLQSTIDFRPWTYTVGASYRF